MVSGLSSPRAVAGEAIASLFIKLKAPYYFFKISRFFMNLLDQHGV